LWSIDHGGAALIMPRSALWARRSPRDGRGRHRPDPAPRRNGPTWREFRTARAEEVSARDLIPIDLVDPRRLYAPVFLEHCTGRPI
jgi:hypothetical protein